MTTEQKSITITMTETAPHRKPWVAPVYGQLEEEQDLASVLRRSRALLGAVVLARIALLRAEAAGSGDDDGMVALCDRALHGDERARTECLRVLADVEAQS